MGTRRTAGARLVALVGLAVVTISLAACGTDPGAGAGDGGGDGGGAGTGNGGGTAMLARADEDRATFEGRSATQNGEPRPLVPRADTGDGPDTPASTVTITFSADGLSATGGCNTMSGDARISDGRLVLAEGLATTEMACDQPLMDQDAWLAALLADEPSVELAGEVLTLRTATAGLVLERQAIPLPAALVDTTWALDTIIGGDVASSVPAGVTATLRFGPDGAVAVETGCNVGSGAYEVEDPEEPAGDLRISDLTTTARGCDGPQAQVESAVLAVLGGDGGTVTYEVEGTRLTLTRGDRTLAYRAP